MNPMVLDPMVLFMFGIAMVLCGIGIAVIMFALSQKKKDKCSPVQGSKK